MSSRQNLYPGINPHLNSHLQHKEGWKGFHTLHLADIARLLEDVLPPNYYTASEDSLQIGTLHPGLPLTKSRTVTNITIYQRGESSGIEMNEPATDASVPTLILPVTEVIEDDDYLSSVIIYKDSGEAVTRIELLSPANKPFNAHYPKYLAKRESTLRSGLRLVEVDYLHTTAPIIDRIPSYPDHEDGAQPHAIIVSDPRPTYAEGMMRVYGFGVLDPLPVIDLPLEGSETVRFDFRQAYQRTFEGSRLFWQIYADYTQEPVGFEAYHDADQHRIRTHMQAINQAAGTRDE